MLNYFFSEFFRYSSMSTFWGTATCHVISCFQNTVVTQHIRVVEDLGMIAVCEKVCNIHLPGSVFSLTFKVGK